MPQGMLVRVQSRAQKNGSAMLPSILFFVFESSVKARMVKLVDTYVSGAYAARCAGSSPVPGTFFLLCSPRLQRGLTRRRFISRHAALSFKSRAIPSGTIAQSLPAIYVFW